MNRIETKKLDELTTFPTQLVAVCSTTGNRVLCNRWQQTSVLEDEAIWWQCPDCKGWHVIVINRVNNTTTQAFD